MKLSLCFAFLVFALYANGCLAAPSKLCGYLTIRLGIAIDEETCHERCKAYTNPREERCIGYYYDMERETCSGYSITYEKGYRSFNKCEIIDGADISFDIGSHDAMASIPAEGGCSLRTASLGIASTEKECEEECRNLPSGEVYGGCAAYMYKESDLQCTGVVSFASSYSVCGSPR